MGRGEGEGGGGILNHTRVAPAGRIKMQAPHKAIIPPTKCLSHFFSLTVAPRLGPF